MIILILISCHGFLSLKIEKRFLVLENFEIFRVLFDKNVIIFFK